MQVKKWAIVSHEQYMKNDFEAVVNGRSLEMKNNFKYFVIS